MKKIEDYFTAGELAEFTKAELKELFDEYEIEYDKNGNKEALLAVASEHFIKGSSDESEDDNNEPVDKSDPLGLKDELLGDKGSQDSESEEPQGVESALGVILTPKEVLRRKNAQRVKQTQLISNTKDSGE